MGRKKRLIDKRSKKAIQKKCYFCEESNLAVLDAHRIQEGKNGGEYTDFNTVIVCANCHRKIHNGIIKLDRKYYTTSGKWILHFWIDGIEKYE